MTDSFNVERDLGVMYEGYVRRLPNKADNSFAIFDMSSLDNWRVFNTALFLGVAVFYPIVAIVMLVIGNMVATVMCQMANSHIKQMTNNPNTYKGSLFEENKDRASSIFEGVCDFITTRLKLRYNSAMKGKVKFHLNFVLIVSAMGYMIYPYAVPWVIYAASCCLREKNEMNLYSETVATLKRKYHD